MENTATVSVTVVSKGSNLAVKMEVNNYISYSEVYRDGETITKFLVNSWNEASKILDVASKNGCTCTFEDLK